MDAPSGDLYDQWVQELHMRVHASMAAPRRNGSVLEQVVWYYRDHVHCWLGMTLCVVGIGLNVCSCAILRKRQILVTGNVALLAVSLCYLTTSIAFLLTLATLYCATPHWAPKLLRNTYANMVVALISGQLQLTAHSITLWLGVLMALQRLVCITARVPIRRNRLVSERVTRLCIGLVVVGVVVSCVPGYMAQLVARAAHSNQSTLMRHVCRNGTSERNGTQCVLQALVVQLPRCEYYVMNLRPALRTPVHWIYVGPHKLLPCALMILLGAVLIRSLRQLVDRRKSLVRRDLHLPRFCWRPSRNCADPHRAGSISEIRLREVNRHVTRMLIAIVLLMVATQLPPAVLLLCDSEAYRKFGDAFDILSMLNNTASFVLYCKMSVTFRKEFIRQIRCSPRIFRRSCFPSSPPSPPPTPLTPLTAR